MQLLFTYTLVHCSGGCWMIC